MAVAWQVRPLSSGGWQVLTPGHTQTCGIRSSEAAAVDAACARVADEGGGSVTVYSGHGTVDRSVSVSPSLAPYIPDAPAC